ncbi:MAG: sulfite exporter TauE/SafE family protein [Gemmatimonadales bacterium]
MTLALFLVLLPSPEQCVPGERESGLMRRKSPDERTVIRARDGAVFEYPTCWRVPGVLMALGGGGLTGLISAGLPEITTTQLIMRCRVPARVAIATSVFTLAITALVGAGIHALSARPAWNVVAWSIPGVLIGSTVGSRLGRYIPGPLMQKILGVVFGAVGALVLVLELLAR